MHAYAKYFNKMSYRCVVSSIINPFVPNTLSLHPENFRKPYGFLMFSGGRERAHWEQMG